jgi:hypothetical protein
MNEPDPLQELADRYSQDGYRVIVHPHPEDLPPFFANSDILLLAFKGGEYVAFHPAPAEAPATDRPARMSAREPDAMHMRTLLMEAERCLRAGAVEAALLLAWSVTEAALREIAREPNTAYARQPMPRDLIRAAARLGKLSPPDIETLEHSWQLRTVIAHGLRPDALPPELVQSLIDLARRLVAAPAEPGPEPSSDLRSVGYGYGIRQAGDLLPLAAHANRALSEVLGPSAGLVAAEWDRTEDTRGRPLITLRLADHTGAVTGAFAPDELRSYPALRNRLYRLWGDLLQVRNHQQLQELGPG